MATRTLVVDNGGSAIKAGFASTEKGATYKSIPNCVTQSRVERKAYVGSEMETCKDYSGLVYRLPFEKGYLTQWDVEKRVWDRLFKGKDFTIEPSSSNLIITEPVFNLPNIGTTYDQLIFEDYGFQAYTRMSAPHMASFNEIPRLFRQHLSAGKKRIDCAVIVDSGYSFTHIIPIWKGQPILVGIRRINVGGKFMTNHLKEIISFRSWNMMEETHLVNQVKEACCYVSNDFWTELEICKKQPKNNRILQQYVLPDYSAQQNGYVKRRPGEKKRKDKKKRQTGTRGEGADKATGKRKQSSSNTSAQNKRSKIDSKDKGKAKDMGDDSAMEVDSEEEEDDFEDVYEDSDDEVDEDVDDQRDEGDESDPDSSDSEPTADDDEQVLTMNNERFTVPEVLFNPSDIGMDQAGIPEAILNAIMACDQEIRGLLFANIVLQGGNANLPGFKKRVEKELREISPSEFEIRVGMDKDPAGYAWKGGNRLATMDEYATELKSRLVTRREYFEVGSALCESRFRAGI